MSISLKQKIAELEAELAALKESLRAFQIDQVGALDVHEGQISLCVVTDLRKRQTEESRGRCPQSRWDSQEGLALFTPPLVELASCFS